MKKVTDNTLQKFVQVMSVQRGEGKVSVNAAITNDKESHILCPFFILSMDKSFY